MGRRDAPLSSEQRPGHPTPSHPLLLGAMSVVLVVLVVLVQTNPTQCFSLTPSLTLPHESLSLSIYFSLFLSLSPLLYLSLSFSLYFGSLLLCSTLFLCLSFVCTSTSQPTASATHSERPHPHPPPTTPNQPAATSSADAHILLPLRCRPHFPQQSPT